MIHTASLVHDDVLDECSIRRGEGGEKGLHGCMGGSHRAEASSAGVWRA